MPLKPSNHAEENATSKGESVVVLHLHSEGHVEHKVYNNNATEHAPGTAQLFHQSIQLPKHATLAI